MKEKLNIVFSEVEEEPLKISYEEFQQMKIERRKLVDYTALMVVTASTSGATASLLFKFLQTNSFQIEWLFSGLGVLVASIAILTTISVFKKGNESEQSTSKRTTLIASLEFENEVLKILERPKEYQIVKIIKISRV